MTDADSEGEEALAGVVLKAANGKIIHIGAGVSPEMERQLAQEQEALVGTGPPQEEGADTVMVGDQEFETDGEDVIATGELFNPDDYA